MDNKPEGRVMYEVAQGRDGAWCVNESGFEQPIASFAKKDDAVEYARLLAETKRVSVVDVKD